MNNRLVGRSGRPAPVLVTGTHRSGTTWLGQMLSLSEELGVVHEPFNPSNKWSWLEPVPAHWYEHVTESSDHGYDAAIERLIALRYPLRTMATRVRTPRTAAAVARDGLDAARWRKAGRSLLMKDPIAFFSTPWLADQHGLQPVVCVRHPAAFVSSLKRLDWHFDFANWADQPSLLAGPLRAHAERIERLRAEPADIIDQGIAVWCIMNAVVHDDYSKRAGWHVIRYEDFASDPHTRFAALYKQLGLTWNVTVEERMTAFTAGSAGEVAAGKHMSVKRDSRSAMWTWLDRLTPDEIAKIRTGTAAVAQHFYTDLDWG